jgi:hypothetical protein
LIPDVPLTLDEMSEPEIILAAIEQLALPEPAP